MKSIVQTNINKCFICGSTYGLEWHHIMNGAFRKKSEQHGGVVRVCSKCHTGNTNSIHNNATVRLALKDLFQREFEKKHSKEEWLKIFKKNYIDEEEIDKSTGSQDCYEIGS